MSCLHEMFLANDSNKRQFIQFLRDKLQESRFQTEQAEEDADVLIVSTVLKLSREKRRF